MNALYSIYFSLYPNNHTNVSIIKHKSFIFNHIFLKNHKYCTCTVPLKICLPLFLKDFKTKKRFVELARKMIIMFFGN